MEAVTLRSSGAEKRRPTALCLGGHQARHTADTQLSSKLCFKGPYRRRFHYDRDTVAVRPFGTILTVPTPLNSVIFQEFPSLELSALWRSCDGTSYVISGHHSHSAAAARVKQQHEHDEFACAVSKSRSSWVAHYLRCTKEIPFRAEETDPRNRKIRIFY